MNGWSLRRLRAVDEAQIKQLADVLIDCVEGGASVSFMDPLTRERAEAFWRRVADGVHAGQRALVVAEDDRGICGTVQLLLDLPENQPHRADVAKMLVHRRARRQGVGAALMHAAEATARDCGRMSSRKRMRPSRSPRANQISAKPAAVAGTLLMI